MIHPTNLYFMFKKWYQIDFALDSRGCWLFERRACYLYISWEKKMFMHNLKNLHSFMLFKNKFNVYIVEKMVWLNMIYWIKSHSCMPDVTVWSSWVPSTGGHWTGGWLESSDSCTYIILLLAVYKRNVVIIYLSSFHNLQKYFQKNQQQKKM